MLRIRTPTRVLTPGDRDAALDLCGRHPEDNVFVAARILEGGLDGSTGSIVGYAPDGRLEALCWVAGNVVAVETTDRSRAVLADRIRRYQRRAASLLGPADETLALWRRLESSWGPARSVRSTQPHLAASTPPSALGVPVDRRLRPARGYEIDLVMPASEHMFTAEIGYPPYRGSARTYRAVLSRLIERGHTYVIVEDGEVIFKADVGSVGLGCAQLQGVWLTPRLRGQGVGAPAMAAVLEHVLADIAPTATLYVNDYNTAALAMYERIGMTRIGTFATVLL